MAENTEDRRIMRTKMALHEALTGLILEKRYDKITVQNIIDRANVGRSTFYAHFLDKEDLLLKGVAMFSEQLDSHIGTSDQARGEAGHIFHSITFFRHASMHHDLYKAMMEGGGADVLMAAARSHLKEDILAHLDEMLPEGDAIEMPLPVITNFLAGAMLSVLMWWLETERPFSPEEIDAMFQQLAMSGVEKLLSRAS